MIPQAILVASILKSLLSTVPVNKTLPCVTSTSTLKKIISLVSKYRFFICVLIRVSSTNSPRDLSSLATAIAVEAAPTAPCGVQWENKNKEKNKILGEITVIISASYFDKKKEVSDEEILDYVNELKTYNLSNTIISKLVSKKYKISKRRVYQLIIGHKIWI